MCASRISFPHLLATALMSLLLIGTTPAGEDGVAPRRAPDFELRDINPRSETHGQTLTLADLYAERGVVLNFIASWCAPCWSELISFQKLADGGAPIVCIAADEYGPTTDLLRKAGEISLTLPILHVPRQRISEMEALYDHPMLPATYVIAPNGDVREVLLGTVESSTLLESVRALSN